MTHPYRVFVSSTTADLGGCRAAVAEVLRKERNLDVIDEAHFPVMRYDEVRRLLWEKIQISDGVIFLIGFHFGGGPEVAVGQQPRSFAQIEWDIARELEKPCHVFVQQSCEGLGSGIDEPPPEGEVKKRTQEQHREAVMGGKVDRFWHEFSTFAELVAKVRAAEFPSGRPGRPRKIRALPYSTLGESFVGRDEDLSRVVEHFFEADGRTRRIAPPTLLHGLGGVGKTRLAVEYALAHDRLYDVLLFVSAESPFVLEASLAGLALPPVLDLVPETESDELKRLQAVMHWLESHDRWLLIVDNVDTEDAMLAVQSRLGAVEGTGHMLITGRYTKWDGGVRSLQLGMLDQKAAVGYLLRRCVNRRPEDSDEGAAALLASEIEGLPLALEQAAAYVNLHAVSLREYHVLWRENDERVRAWFDPAVMRYPRSVATTWETSFSQLSRNAGGIIGLLAWLSSESLPRDVFRGEVLEDVLRKHVDAGIAQPLPALKELTDYSLVHRTGPDGIRIHRQVQEVARHRLILDARDRIFLETSLRVMDAYPAGDPYEASQWPYWVPVGPHILALAGWSEHYEIPEPCGRLLNQLGICMMRRSSYREAHGCFFRSLAFRAMAHGIASAECAVVMGNLGWACGKLDKFPEAEKHYLGAANILTRMGPGEEADAAKILGNLGGIYIEMNRFAEAEQFMNLAEVAEERAMAHGYSRPAGSLGDKGGLFRQMGWYDKAEACFREAVLRAGKEHGADHPDVATLTSNLGLVLQDLGRYDEAEACFRAALASDLHTFGSGHSAVGRDRNNLALLLRAMGRLAEAKALLRESLKHDKRTFGPRHSEVADDCNNLGLVLIDQGRWKLADVVLNRALEIDSLVHGRRHVRVATALANISFIRKAQGENRKALDFLEEAKGIQIELLGADHPDLGPIWINIASLLQLEDETRDARRALRKAGEIYRKRFGRRHHRLGTLLSNFAHVYWQEGRMARAECLYLHALKQDIRIHGPLHPEIAVDQFNLSVLLRQCGRDEEADRRHAEAVRIAGSSARGCDRRIRSILEPGGGWISGIA